MKQYDVCLKKWWSFCQNQNIDVYSASTLTVISFLTMLYNNGSQYGTLNTCRSALSLILDHDITSDSRLQRFLKGVFRLRPPLPKYNSTWDTNCVLDHLDTWLAHRMQTLSKINVKNVEFQSNTIAIKIPDFIKTTRPGSKQPIIYLPFFRDKPSICPAQTLIAYLDRTKELRKSDYLFIGLKKPHKAVCTQSLSRWIKRTLSECGIDARVFSAHSTRHAAASRALARRQRGRHTQDRGLEWKLQYFCKVL